MTKRKREELLARVADVIRRSDVEDADELVRWLEQNLVEIPQEPGRIRTDGVYVGGYDVGGSTRYLRFFENGRAVAVTSTGRPEQVRTWLLSGSGHSEGECFVAGRCFDFRGISSSGRIDYDGRLLADGRILLRWHSHINRNRGEDTYEFFPYG